MPRRFALSLAASALVLGAISCSDEGDTSDGGPTDAGEDSGAPSPPPTIALYDDEAPVTALGQEALALAPAWLRHDVGLSLRKQEAARADALAALLVDDTDARTLDEIAFTIAHTSPETLANEGFEPSLLALNAQLVYQEDEALDYVELVDEADAGAEGASTTAVYSYETDAGVEQAAIDRDIYYWFVVHPKMEDENPWFIDAWSECAASSLECAATPETGWAWRDFLWDAADDTCDEAGMCPALDAWLPGEGSVWNGRAGGDATGAIREIVDFMLYQPVEGTGWLSFGAFGERSIQPNRIYGLGRGNCGEWADMTTAIGRTALIPTANASPTSWDHTWNSFYYRGDWVELEPVNNAIDADYSGWGDSFAGSNSFYIARGDGLVLLQAPDYRDDIFTMRVVVTDAAGAPVPGASVSVWSPWVIDGTEYWAYAGEGPTDATGAAEFPLVALGEYAVRIETPIGTWPEAENTITYASSGVAAGETDVQEYSLAVALPSALPATEIGAAGEATARLHVGTSELSGRFTAYGQRFGTTYTTEGPAPELQALLVDDANYALLEAGEPFDAVWAGAADAFDAEIDIPLDAAWYLVLSNAAQVGWAAFGALRVDVAPLEDGAWTGPVSFESSYEILPGGRLAVAITPGT